ncbi:hypothetical protein K438DRAFT_2000104 [Mycena galopus ATCC 62051]|nr:hypothetical protein K438DRAFT_2000104 [Mycena galopus ATCC 62051]
MPLMLKSLQAASERAAHLQLPPPRIPCPLRVVLLHTTRILPADGAAHLEDTEAAGLYVSAFAVRFLVRHVRPQDLPRPPGLCVRMNNARTHIARTGRALLRGRVISLRLHYTPRVHLRDGAQLLRLGLLLWREADPAARTPHLCAGLRVYLIAVADATLVRGDDDERRVGVVM